MPTEKNPRKDVFAKVTGRAKYAGDLKLPGMVYASVVRSPIASGNILSIDAAAARAMPGVLAVYTGADIPGIPGQPKERPVLCQKRVRYIGDGVALVVAETMAEAREAAKAVQVEYDETPALLDCRDALKEDAPQLHEGGNVICNYGTKRGDAETALKNAKHVLHRQYSTQRVQHVCLEAEVAVASHDALTGLTTIYCPINSPFAIRKVIAEALGCPHTDVRVVLATIGGSFGGKNYDTAVAASRAAIVSRKLGRPCKIANTREESITEGTKRHPVYADYTIGFDDDGMLKAAKIDVLLDGGAYTSKTFPVTTRMAIEATGPYYVPNVDTKTVSVYTNNVYSDALRGFGSPQVDFCSESIMDEIAAHLGLDPLEVRKRNMLREGGLSSFGQTMEDVTLGKCLAAVEEQANIAQRKERIAAFNKQSRYIKKGFGVALLHRGESFGAAGQGVDTASGMVSIQPDGSVTVSSSIAEVGQGAATLVVNIVHEALGIPREKIRVPVVDTATMLDAGPTVATRGTLFSGGAIYNAVQQLQQKIATYAEKHIGTTDVVFKDEMVCAKADEGQSVPLAAIIRDVQANSDHLNALGYFAAPPLDYDKSCGVGEAYMSYAYGAAAAEVTVDTQTGTVSVDEYFAAHDVGHALDVEEVKGQILGGVSMGVGYALMEEVEMSAGRVRNLNFENYIIPTVLDMPHVHPIVLEEPGKHGPLGAKGLGEPATCVVAPAIVNAIADATGRRIRDLPANLEQVALGKALKKG